MSESHSEKDRGASSNGPWEKNDIEIPDAPEITLPNFSEVKKSGSRYKHDCDACHYLGQFGKYDAYYCPTNGELVARYSDRGQDYSSASAGIDADLLSATMLVVRAMAEKAGYLYVVD